MPKGRSRWQGRLLAAVLIIAVIGLGARLATTGVGVDTDIQAILPQSTANAEGAAIRHAGASIASRIVIGVVGGDGASRRSGAAALQDRLVATGIFVPAADDLAQTMAWTRANRYEIACARELSELNAAWGAALAQKARVALFSGMLPLSGADVAADPFLLDFHQITCLLPGNDVPAEARVAGRLTASPFALSVQEKINEALLEWRNDERHQTLSLLRSGSVFFAEAAGAQAKQEITLVGGVSVLLILLLYSFSFRSPRTAALALLTVGAGAMGGAAACFAAFGVVHFSVFVFGSALTGVSADYAVHTFAARRAGHSGERFKLQRALTISMLTSAAGFGALLVFDITLFTQIGVFAMGGLAAAWLFAMTALPRLDSAPLPPSLVQTFLFSKLRAVRAAGSQRGVGFVATVAVALIFAVAVPKITFVDDLRRFQTLSPALKAEREALFDGTSDQFSPRFLLSSGSTLEAAKQAEEHALAAIGAKADRFLALSRFDPSLTRRTDIRTAYQNHLFAPQLAQMAAVLGLSPSAAPGPNGDAPRPEWLEALHFERGGQTYLMAPMLEGTPSAPTAVGGRIIDPARVYGGALQDYRQSALRVFGLASLFAALILGIINGKIRAALLIVPPIMGCALALAIPAIFGLPITLFSILALFIVLGAGIDFSVFQWEMSDDETGWTGAAVVIAALSTCAAMGMLGFSATLPVQSFGITIAIGVLAAMVFSFVAPQRTTDGNDARNL